MSKSSPSGLALELFRVATSAVHRQERTDQPRILGLRSEWALARSTERITAIRVSHEGLELLGSDGRIIDKVSVNDLPADPRSMREFRTAVLAAYTGRSAPLEAALELPPGSVMATLSSVAQLFQVTETRSRLAALGA